MYRFLDERIATLDDGGRFTVEAIRLWISALGDRKCPADAITPLFLDRRMIGALAPFHRSLTLLAIHARIQIGFARSCSPVVAEGEALFLSLLDRDNDRLTVCEAAVTSPHAERLCHSVMELEAAMQIAGLAPGPARR